MISELLLHTMATPELDPGSAIDLAVDLGFDGIELIVDDEYRCAVEPRSTAAALAGLRRRADRRGTGVRMVTAYPADLSSADPSVRDAGRADIRSAIGIAHALGAAGVRVLAGRQAVTAGWAGRLEQLIEALREPADLAGAMGVQLLVENHMDTLATSAARTREIVDRLAHDRVGIVFDPANLAILGAERPATAIQLQAPLIRHLHVKNFVPADTEQGRVPAPLDGGVVDWPAVLSALNDSGYTGPACFEYERRWFPELPDAASAAGDFLNILSPWRGSGKDMS